jgi:hypothetical protein
VRQEEGKLPRGNSRMQCTELGRGLDRLGSVDIVPDTALQLTCIYFVELCWPMGDEPSINGYMEIVSQGLI